MTIRMAVFGSAFNPPTLGHESVLMRLTHFDSVLLVPSIAHAWGKEMLDYKHRCKMVEAFIGDVNLPNLSLSLVEQSLWQQQANKQHPITTYAVLSELQKQYPTAQLTFVMGPDNLLNFSKFYQADVILRQWSVLTCPETLAVRSTQVRQRLMHHQSIQDFTTASVEHYIVQHRLYHSYL